jgi:hypothetical protein
MTCFLEKHAIPFRQSVELAEGEHLRLVDSERYHEQRHELVTYGAGVAVGVGAGDVVGVAPPGMSSGPGARIVCVSMSNSP